VSWAFVGVLHRIDLQKRSERLVQKIVNDTIHYLYVGYRREWEHAQREAATVPDMLETLMSPVDDSRLSASEDQEAMIQCLRDHLAAGRIGETEFRLILGTRLQGQSLDDCARELGLSRNAAARRRQRAEAALRRRKGENEDSCT
jgi:DNA-directed RNA polymerase specialized sigma24 family protein